MKSTVPKVGIPSMTFTASITSPPVTVEYSVNHKARAYLLLLAFRFLHLLKINHRSLRRNVHCGDRLQRFACKLTQAL
jgi:hypothetical protein